MGSPIMGEIMKWLFQVRWLDMLSGFASSIITISAFCALVVPKSRVWLLKILTRKEKEEQETKDSQRLEQLMENLVDRMDGFELALQTSLHHTLYQECFRLLKQGCMTADEFKNVQHIYNVYHDVLGGNGTGTEIFERVKKLPMCEECTGRKQK